MTRLGEKISKNTGIRVSWMCRNQPFLGPKSAVGVVGVLPLETLCPLVDVPLVDVPLVDVPLVDDPFFTTSAPAPFAACRLML